MIQSPLGGASGGARDADHALEGCLTALARCRCVAQSLDAGQYARPVGNAEPVGAHMRHCLDHFSSLIAGLESGVVDYDARERGGVVERSPETALKLIESLEAGLAALDAPALERPLRVRIQADADHGAEEVASTVRRELVFLSSHTIHHLAMMVLLAQMNGSELPRDLGLAYSTASYQTRTAGGS